MRPLGGTPSRRGPCPGLSFTGAEGAAVGVTLLETEGRGGVAEIEVDGRRLRVVDAVSGVGTPVRPGVVAGARLEAVLIAHGTGRASAGSARAKGIEPAHGWRYHAHGEIVSTRPLVADCGGLELALPEAGEERWALGDRVQLAIDRIILTRE